MDQDQEKDQDLMVDHMDQDQEKDQDLMVDHMGQDQEKDQVIDLAPMVGHMDQDQEKDQDHLEGLMDLMVLMVDQGQEKDQDLEAIQKEEIHLMIKLSPEDPEHQDLIIEPYQ